MAKRTRMIFNKQGKLTITHDYSKPMSDKPRDRKPVNKTLSAPMIIPDIGEFVSPVGFTDDRPGELISSRAALREHEKKHGVRQCGELTKPEDFSTRNIYDPAIDDDPIEIEWSQYDGH